MPGRFDGPGLGRPHAARDRCAVARREEHRLHDAVALRLPVVEAHVAGAAVLAACAEVAAEVALGVGGLDRQAPRPCSARLPRAGAPGTRACCRSSGAPRSWRSSGPQRPDRMPVRRMLRRQRRRLRRRQTRSLPPRVNGWSSCRFLPSGRRDRCANQYRTGEIYQRAQGPGITAARVAKCLLIAARFSRARTGKGPMGKRIER